MTYSNREELFRSALQDRPALLFDESDSLASYAALFEELGIGVRGTRDVAEAERWAREESLCMAMIAVRPPSVAAFSVACVLRQRCKLTQLVFIAARWTPDLLKQATSLGRARTLDTPRDLAAFRDLLRRQIITWTTTANTGIRR
jgi:DNA-binding NtrC family response regulator